MSKFWSYTDRNRIEHIDGHRITLLDGSWECPMGIDPFFAGDLNGPDSIALINGGLRFAAIVRYSEEAPQEMGAICQA